MMDVLQRAAPLAAGLLEAAADTHGLRPAVKAILGLRSTNTPAAAVRAEFGPGRAGSRPPVDGLSGQLAQGRRTITSLGGNVHAQRVPAESAWRYRLLRMTRQMQW